MLIPFTITAIERDVADADVSGKQIVVGASCSMYIQPADTAINMYEDAAGSNPSTAKVTGTNGEVIVFVPAGDYIVKVNGISRYASIGLEKFTTTALIASEKLYQEGDIVVTSGYTTAGDGGSASWKRTATTGQTASQSPIQLGNSLLNDANGVQWSLVGINATNSREINVLALGALYDGSTDDSAAHTAGLAALNGAGGGVLRLPSGTTKSNIVHTFDKVGIEGEGRSTIINPAAGIGLSVSGITGGLGGYIHNLTFSGNGATGTTTGLYVSGFSRGKFGDLWFTDSLDYCLDIDGDSSTEFTFENVYCHSPVLRGVRYSRTDGVDTGGIYFDTLHITGPEPTAIGIEVTSSHTSRTRAFMFVNKLIADNFTLEAMLLENVSSFFIDQAWLTGTAATKGMLTLRDVKDCFINQAWLQNSSGTGYNLLIDGGAGNDETADLMINQLRTSGPGTSVYFDASVSAPTITRCNIGQWDDTATTQTNDATKLASMRTNTNEGSLTVGNNLTVGWNFNLGTEFTTKVIATGAIAKTKSTHRISPESGTADTLTTISGGTQGDILILMSSSSSNTITVEHGAGNIYLDGSKDKVLTSSRDKLVLVYFGAEWQEISASQTLDFKTTESLINNMNGALPAGTVIDTSGYTNEYDGGGGKWKKTNVTGQTVSQSPAQLADGLLNDANGNQWELVLKERRVNVLSLGAKGDGSTDDTAIIQAAINYAETSDSGVVSIPHGDFLISGSGLRITGNRISLIGAGKNSTRLFVSSQMATIIHIEGPNRATATISNIETSGFSVWCNTAQTAGTAFKVRDLQHWVCRDVHLRNVFGGYDCEGIQQVDMINPAIFNSRASVLAGSFYFNLAATTGAAVKNTEIYITNPNWRNVQAIPAENTTEGLRIGAVDGLWVNGGHIMGCTRELHIQPDTATTQVQGVEFTNVWFDGYSTEHIHITGNSTGGFGGFKFTGCKGINSANYSIFVNNDCANLSGLQFTGGNYSTSTGASFVGYIGSGSLISFDGVRMVPSQSMAGATAILGFGTAAEKFTVTGGIIGSTGGDSPIGLKINNRLEPMANVSGVEFIGCTDEVGLPLYFTDGSKVNAIATDRSIATASSVTVSAVTTAFPAIAEVVTLAGAFATPIESISGGWDGRQVTIVASGGNKTFAHNIGSVGRNIITSTFADVTITTGRFVTATYRAATGAWYLNA